MASTQDLDRHPVFVEFTSPMESPDQTAVNTAVPSRNTSVRESRDQTAVNTAVPSRTTSIKEEASSNSNMDGEAIMRVMTQRTIPDEEAAMANEKAAETDPNVVTWDGPDDPENPMNFPRSKKWRITMLSSAMTFCVSFASSVFSTSTVVAAEEFEVSNEVMILGVSLYVLGFACGPLVWGPLSEVYGRTQPLFVGFAIFTIFNIPVAVAQNVETIMLGRFLSGCFGAAPIAICGGMNVDFWEAVDRGVATAGFAGATFIGPVAGPIVGEFIVASYLGWRWTAWITLIISVFFGILGLLFIPETFAPVLLKRKAERLRHETKNWAIHAPIDEHPVTIRFIFERYFTKPWVMFVQEPILIIFTVYLSLVYSVLYLIFFAYPYSFEVVRGWKTGVASLPFLAIFAGIVICCISIAVDTKTRFQKALTKSGKFVLPEARLPPMIVGSFLLPVGLFWFAWTSNPNISWVPQVLSGIFIGCGLFLVFLPGLLYIVDVYLLNANSALVSNTFVRSLMAAAFPLFATYMYEDLGVAWATSLLAFLCIAMLPFPILFYKYGKTLRAKGKFAFDI